MSILPNGQDEPSKLSNTKRNTPPTPNLVPKNAKDLRKSGHNIYSHLASLGQDLMQGLGIPSTSTPVAEGIPGERQVIPAQGGQPLATLRVRCDKDFMEGLE
ncbi:hypothetical protein E5D57_012783 [Metarhizium anisopliae]|nr:hypothetical protein E5D57_012783 [Metarhizium anisopliae]